MSVEIHLLNEADSAVLERIAPEVFDYPVDARWTAIFFADPRHHLIVAIDDGVVVGMVSAVDYVHPDKAPHLWINELGVAPSHHRRGIATKLIAAILAQGRSLGCTEAWVGTERDNAAAQGVYEKA